ncbi:Ig-like domain-containing protein [Aeromicrobium duanguangcaii]|uniref:Ig-like domain-containing protein n=1 Tax=Aeromicrobium duanguangcaii TaxID=2968086 RepID=UPI002017CA33|nr:Ig-like domain-containing protein [Aeromicrobium duanguangcaii]MCL3837976.1 Ig-like domain repeat protein [Aeromicrobium duanguangcaii]
MIKQRGWRLATVAALMAVPLAAVPAQAADGELASGSDWSVSRTAGGYLVTVDLPKRLPMVSDAPTIEVDGEPIGIATESADGKSLSVFTADASVVDADDVEAGWFSKPSNARVKMATVDEIAQADPEALDANPASLGSYAHTEAVYNFGAQSVPLAGIGGIRGELQGKVYLPKTGGPRPVVLLLHGRHTSCSTGTANPNRWPCGPDQINIPSFAGYDDTGRALASHGYAVVSISANAINSNDNQLALDQGAQARGQLLLDTLSMLKKANEGAAVSYYDAQKEADVTLAQALADQSPLPGLSEGTEGLAPADLVGRFDFSNIGMMGHSRGGEGVTSAATLNQGLENPWNITSILPLAPVDFARMTVPDVAMNVILPYCDGDVSNQQGQHMLDDSRYAFDDDVLRSGVWMMGANHNFYNTVWTPGKYAYSVSDDWGATSTDAVCGPRSSTNIRLSADEQYDAGTAYMAGWFRLTMGDEKQFLPMFDGSASVPEVLGSADIRSVSTAPASARKTIATFEKASSLVKVQGAATATVCASAAGRTTTQTLPACPSTSIGTSALPHWTPASNGGNVPATPVTKFSWTGLGTASTPSEVRVNVPASARNASDLERLSVKMAADDTVASRTALSITVVDGSGKTYTAPVDELNPLATTRLPASTSALLKKIVLQQVDLPVATLKDAGLNVSDLREVRFGALAGPDALAAGGVFLSDLAFEKSALGTLGSKTMPTINVDAPVVDEGNAPGTADVAVYLDREASVRVTGYVSVLGSATGRAGIAMEKVTFAPGETCKVVTAPILGDTATSTANSASVKTSVINTQGAVMGTNALDWMIVQEDDGVTGSATALPSAGVQGDACAELAAKDEAVEVSVGDSTPQPGESLTVTAGGFRSGEGVTITVDGLDPVVTAADATGVVTAAIAIPATATRGAATVSVTASGTGRTGETSVSILDASATSLSISPEAPAINEAVTLTATVTGGDTTGTVEFLDGDTSLGTAEVVDGSATLEVPGFKAGAHTLVARFVETGVTAASSSNPVAFTLVKGKPTMVMSLSSASTVFGQAAKLSARVGDADGGTVTFRYGSVTKVVPVTKDGSAALTLPATLKPGRYTVSAAYDGTDRTEASASISTSLVVAKKGTSASVSAPKSVKGGKALRGKIAVRGGVAGVAPTGTAKVYVAKAKGGYKLAKTVRVPASGKVSYSVKAPKKRQSLRVKVVYSGDVNYGSSNSTVKAVRVR